MAAGETNKKKIRVRGKKGKEKRMKITKNGKKALKMHPFWEKINLKRGGMNEMHNINPCCPVSTPHIMISCCVYPML